MLLHLVKKIPRCPRSGKEGNGLGKYMMKWHLHRTNWKQIEASYRTCIANMLSHEEATLPIPWTIGVQKSRHFMSLYRVFKLLFATNLKVSKARWDEAKRLMRNMVEMRIFPDIVTFNILVDAFSKEGRVEEVEDMLKTMIERGERPDVITYNALMDGYCLKGEMEEAFQILRIMMESLSYLSIIL